MIGRFIVVNTVGVGLLVAAHLLGTLPALLEVDKWHAFYAIGALTLISLGYVAAGRREDASWVSLHLPLAGLILTVTGTVFGAIQFHATGDMDAFKLDVITAMVGTLAGMLGYLWTDLVLKVCR